MEENVRRKINTRNRSTPYPGRQPITCINLVRFPTHPASTSSSQLRLLTSPRHRRCPPPNTPILEISSRIHPRPSNATFKTTTRHHSDAPSTHPLIRLMHSTSTPNGHLEEILIPEPSPISNYYLLYPLPQSSPINPFASARHPNLPLPNNASYQPPKENVQHRTILP